MAEMIPNWATGATRRRVKPTPATARTSFWTDAPRQDFTARATAELVRMSSTRESTQVDSVHGIKELQHLGKGRPRKRG